MPGQAGGDPGADRPPVRPVRGLTLRLLRARRRAGPRADGARAGPRAQLLPGAASRPNGGGRGHASRSVASTWPSGPARSATCSTTPAGSSPRSRSTTWSTRPPGCGPGRPTTRPSWAATEVAGLLVATGHYRNGILLAPDHRHRGGPAAPHRRATPPDGPFAAFGPDRFASGRRATARPRAGAVGCRPMTPVHVNGTPWDGPPGTTVARWWPSGATRPAASPWPSTARWSRRAGGRSPGSRTGTGSRS